MGDVDPPARAGRRGGRQGADVHQPADRRGRRRSAIGLVDRAVPDDELDATVDALAAEIAANSPGTNRIVKQLLRDRLTTTRDAALLHERTLPYGLPDDMAERMARPRR